MERNPFPPRRAVSLRLTKALDDIRTAVTRGVLQGDEKAAVGNRAGIVINPAPRVYVYNTACRYDEVSCMSDVIRKARRTEAWRQDNAGRCRAAYVCGRVRKGIPRHK